MANCKLKNWAYRTSDSLTQWKEEYGHRIECDMLKGNCDLHDTPEAIAEYQKLLEHKINSYKEEIYLLQHRLDKHQEKWGIQSATKGAR